MTDGALAELVAAGVIRPAEPDPVAARAELAVARAHLEIAAAAAATDANGAFQLAYDAARKAIVAQMRANGYRLGSGAGAHARTGRYADAALARIARPHIDAFDDMRTVRNQSEYDAVLLEERDVHDALVHARALVAAVERELA